MIIVDEKEIFLHALDCSSVAERTRYLDDVCGIDTELRRSIESLLAAHERTQNFVDAIPLPVADVRAQLESDAGIDPQATAGFSSTKIPVLDRVGEVIGPYRLMEKIGEGGFGQVYVAEQVRPVRRKVALKLLKPGMDSREVIARFEAERQALALMNHPNIAHVFDAGTTAVGQPFFVMELVRGVPITNFCDQNQLTTRDRLLLFVDVCYAVQHAHQKGIIHRDLKPSNVMVTLHDGTPIVKVIDFGVAKALSEPLTDRTLYTRFTQIIGTPLYMSPEQAEMSGLDVDTRSDIYSLGVILYELLTGTTPFDQRRMQTAPFDELRRIIREEEPLRPSVRLSTSGQLLSTISANQRTEPRLLSTTLRGDLDWIVMKALEKDRRRRYDTALELVADIRRYLDQQPVIARPPTPWYRFWKFARRNKVALTTASLVATAMIVGTAVSTWQAILANRARAEADALRKEAVDFAESLKEANVLLDSARANFDESRLSLADQQYTKATELQPNHYLVWSGRASMYVRLGLWQEAAADYAKAVKLGAPANNPGWWGVPQLLVYAGDAEAYQKICNTMWLQMDQSSDPFFQLFVIRNLCLSTNHTTDARTVAQRADELYSQIMSGERRPASRGNGPDRFGGPPRGRRPPRGESPDMPPPDRPPRDDGRPGPRRRDDSRPPPPDDFRELSRDLTDGVLPYSVGLAAMRVEDWERAIDLFDKALSSPTNWPAAPICNTGLAIAYHAQGKQPEAEAALVRMEEAIDRWTDILLNESLDHLEFPWFDYIECLVLYREAHERVRGTSPADDERHDMLRARAIGVLQGEETR